MAKYFYKKNEILSPSGFVILDESYRRGKIDYSIRKDGYCTWCNKVVMKPKRNWCSPECVELYNMTQPRTLKKLIKKRDKGICASCGGKFTRKSQWDLEHIIPISEGGHPFDLNNLQILCIKCHKIKTKKMYQR